MQQAQTGASQTVSAEIVAQVSTRNAQSTPSGEWGSLGFVIGATVDWTDAGLTPFRPSAPILAPGFGAQGAGAADLRARFGPSAGMVVAAESRSILSAGPEGLGAAIETRIADYRKVIDVERPDSVPPAQERTVPEVDRAAAARRAVERRRARAALKRDLTTRVISPQTVAARAFDDADSVSGSMRITDFLLALPAIGVGKRDRILHDLDISPVKRLAGWCAPARELDPLVGRALPGVSAAHRPQQTSRARRSHGCRQGHGRRSHPRAPPRDPLVGLGHHPARRAPAKIHGVHYYFVDDVEFDRLIDDGELLEHAVVHNRSRYGTPRAPIDADRGRKDRAPRD